MATPSHATAKDVVLQALTSSERTGLSPSQVTAARKQFGWNELASVAPEPAWKKFLAQFSDVVVWIQIAAALDIGCHGRVDRHGSDRHNRAAQHIVEILPGRKG